MENESMTGTHMKRKRLEKGLTGVDLGKIIGVTPNYIYMFENGQKSIPANRLDQINEVLDNAEHYKVDIETEKASKKKKTQTKKIGGFLPSFQMSAPDNLDGLVFTNEHGESAYIDVDEETKMAFLELGGMTRNVE